MCCKVVFTLQKSPKVPKFLDFPHCELNPTLNSNSNTSNKLFSCLSNKVWPLNYAWGVGVATTSWKLLQISEKLSFPSLIMKPISIFWSDESPGRTRSAHVACAQLLSRLAGHSVCGLGIHPIKKLKWVSPLGLKNLAFQKFAVISMNVQFFWPPLLGGNATIIYSKKRRHSVSHSYC